MKIKRFLFDISVAIFFTLAGFAIFLFIIYLTAYRPEKEIILTNMPQTCVLDSDTVEILTWNIGYAGLDCEMDFFYDGGKKSRTTKQKTIENLDSISCFLETCTADFIFLQEVDKKSKRTYNIDQVSAISRRTPLYTAIFATNYKSLFVPLPLNSPMGQVESGIMTLCRHIPAQSLRYAYPSKQSGIKQLFLLNRCFIMCKFPLKNGKYLILINTHNSAFDDNGTQRYEEMNFLKNFITTEYDKGNYVIVGGDWNQVPPLENAAEYKGIGTEYFMPLAISQDFMPKGWKFVSDGKATNRFMDAHYIKDITKETLIDFFLVSQNVEVVSTNRIDKKYSHSDHNPVMARFVLKNIEPIYDNSKYNLNPQRILTKYGD